MTWQEPAVVFVVGAAIGYLIWKLGLSTGPRRKKRRPDVKLSRLRKSARKE